MRDEAAQPADEGVQLCETHSHNAFARYFLYIQAILGAARGQADKAKATTEPIIRRAVPSRAPRAAHHGHHTAAVAAPGHGDFAGAYEHTNTAGPAGSPASTQLRAAGWSRQPAGQADLAVGATAITAVAAELGVAATVTATDFYRTATTPQHSSTPAAL
ncbi:hypothetical protein [Streptomyces sp. NPDC002205]|uniref:hypothetical protein n=1 Tax=Streptomyces sp. NPDC002205 TaxID=3154411 RepID=UPI00331E62DF